MEYPDLKFASQFISALTIKITKYRKNLSNFKYFKTK